MITVFGCITHQHDVRLVLLACIIAACGCYTSLSVLARAGNRRAVDERWLGLAAVTGGAAIWTTHFVAMLAYRPGIPVDYDLWLTALSILTAIWLTWAGFDVALRVSPVLGGALAGSAVGVTHFIGIAALSLKGDFHWNLDYVVLSLGIGIVLYAIALPLFMRGAGLQWRILAALLMGLGVVGLHMTAMSAITLGTEPRAQSALAALVAPDWLVAAIITIMVMLIGIGQLAAALEHRLAQRATRDAEKLRSYVAELEAARNSKEAATDSLRLALEEAAAANVAKSVFLANMSHELRTPLNAIIGFSDMMREELFGPLGDPRYLDYVVDINTAGQHLLQLITDILDFSKIDSGRFDLCEEAIDLVAMVERAVTMVMPAADQRGVRISSQCAADLPKLRGESRRVLQILLNLLSNAVKFTPLGGNIGVTALNDAGAVVITVTDTGIGIAAEDIPRVLERFGQVDSGMSRRYEGTGLGLPLAKRLTELHGGTLEINSTVNVGTRIVIRFPAERMIAAATTR